MHQSAIHTNASLARVLTHAIETADKPKHQIASEAGIHRETLLKVMRGQRAISIDRAVRIFEVCGACPHAAIVLTLAGEEVLACEWMHRDMGAFLDEFITSLPGQLDRHPRSPGRGTQAALGNRHLAARGQAARQTH